MDNVSEVWFNEVAPKGENRDRLIQIGEAAIPILNKEFSIKPDTADFCWAFYNATWKAITEYLKKSQEEESECSVCIADRLVVGYTNNYDEDDEKSGNYMIFINNVEPKKGLGTNNPENETKSLALCTKWMSDHVREDHDALNQIATIARKNLGELVNLKIESNVFILPVFCTLHTMLVNSLRTMREELQEPDLEIDVCGLFTIGIMMSEEDGEVVYYTPSIALKLALKDDAKASSDENEE